MKTLAVISQKGGSGKTLLSIHLAVAAERDGKPSAIIDLDPQASAAGWGDSRKEETPVIVSAQSSRLDKVLAAAESAGAALAIIDTAPSSESASLAAAKAADFILVPCRPAVLDLRAISHSIDLIKLAGRPACVVLNTVPPRGNLAQEAAAAVATYDVPVCPVHIGQRTAFLHALTAGLAVQEYEPQGRAAEEIARLYKWLCKQLNM